VNGIATMRHRQFILPFALVLAAAAWLWRGELERRELADRIDDLGTRLDRPPARPASPSRPERPTAIERDPVDWQAVAAELARGTNLGGLLQTNARLRAAIEAMSVEDLLAAMEELKMAGLEKSEFELLEKHLAMAILLQAPEMGFPRFAVRGKPNWDWFMGGEFSKWVARDKVAAVDWLRQHTGSGGYVPSEMIEDPFFKFLRSDPDTAAAILATRPPEGRREVLRSLSMNELKKSGQEEWAKIMRSQLPPEDVPEAIAWPVMRWSDGDGSPMHLDQVDAYMERIGVTEAEREVCVMAVAQDAAAWWLPTGENVKEPNRFEQLREWVSQHDPALLEPATLVALREVAQVEGFDQAGGLALQFHEETGNDAYLTAVLKVADDRSDPALLRNLIDRLSDPALREKHREEQAHRLE
jgi:hypothetical protein